MAHKNVQLDMVLCHELDELRNNPGFSQESYNSVIRKLLSRYKKPDTLISSSYGDLRTNMTVAFNGDADAVQEIVEMQRIIMLNYLRDKGQKGRILGALKQLMRDTAPEKPKEPKDK